MLSDYFDNYAREYRPYKSGAWCYEDGLLYQGLELLHRATAEDRWLQHMVRLVDNQVSSGGELAGYDPTEFNIDHVKSGRALVYLHQQTGRQLYCDATVPLMNQLDNHPRTRSGVYWHKLNYPWQIWLDGLFMAASFRLPYAVAYDRADIIDDVMGQLLKALEATHDPVSGLYAHAYDESRLQRWSDPESGHSPAYWSRALGWLAMCLVDTAELVGPEVFAPVQTLAENYLNALCSFRQEGGLWLQVINQPDLEGNYQEASASAMFSYALIKGQKLGLVSALDDGLVDSLVQQTVRDKSDGGKEMFDICEVAGLGGFGGNYRDGTAEYYLSERRVADDVKGVGPLMMCVAQSKM